MYNSRLIWCLDTNCLSADQADEPEQISIICPVIAAWRCLLYFKLSFFFRSLALSDALLMAFMRAASSHASDSCSALRRVEFKYRGNKASMIWTGSCSNIKLLSKSLVSVLTCKATARFLVRLQLIKKSNQSVADGVAANAALTILEYVCENLTCRLHQHTQCTL